MSIIRDKYIITASEADNLVEASGSREQALMAAVDVARERARLFVFEAGWYATWNSDNSITVIRRRQGPPRVCAACGKNLDRQTVWEKCGKLVIGYCCKATFTFDINGKVVPRSK